MVALVFPMGRWWVIVLAVMTILLVLSADMLAMVAPRRMATGHPATLW